MLVDRIDEEICDAKTYAENYVEFKAMNDSTWANRYKEMANDELKHADYIHERAVNEINRLRTVYTPPAEMLEMWDVEHKKYVEKTAWIKTMLQL